MAGVLGPRAGNLLTADCASLESEALRYQDVAERRVVHVPGLSQAVVPRPLSSIGIVGAGTMGSGIAIACAAAGLPVMLIDTSAEAARKGIDRVRRHFAEAAERGRVSAAAADAATACIDGDVELERLSEADLVIEAVVEHPAVKASVFATLDRVCRPQALLASNTSTLDIDAIAESTERAGDVLGLHFFSPAHVMRLLEIVRGRDTSPVALATALHFATRLGKVGVVAGNAFGFIGNRMLQPYFREALTLVLEGVEPARIDSLMREFGFAMGPLEVRDLAGIDIALAIRAERARRGELPPDERPFVLLERLAAAGRLGRKTGAGIYSYPPGARRGVEDPWVAQQIAEAAESARVRRRQVDGDEVLDRCLLPLVMEGVRLLEEGIALRCSDVDVVWVNGYGFPRSRGGPMWWAHQQGLADLVSRIDALGSRLSDPFGYWRVPAVLRECAGSGGSLMNLGIGVSGE